MTDDKIYQLGGDERDVKEYAKSNGADLKDTNSLNRDRWKETEACVQANFDDLENGKIMAWQSRNNILAHFKTKADKLVEEAKAEERKDRDEEWIMSMKLNGVDQKIIDEVVYMITPQAISAISNKK